MEQNNIINIQMDKDAYEKYINGAGGEGGGITIVNDEASLDANAKVGSLAVVAKEGTIEYRKVSECATNVNIGELVNTETGTLDVSPLTKVDTISILTTAGVLQSASPVTCMFVREDSMITYDMWVIMTTSDNSGNVVSIGYMPAMNGEGGVLASYSDGTWVINQEGVDAFNQILKSSEYYLVAQSMITGEFPTAEEFAILDSLVQVLAGGPSTAYLYLKKDNWEQLHAKDFEKLESYIIALNNNINDVHTDVDNAINQINETTSRVQILESPAIITSESNPEIMLGLFRNHFVPNENYASNIITMSDWDALN